MEANALDSIDARVLGRELQRARTRRGLTQEEAAKILGVARTTVTAIEKGERRLKPKELIRLAGAYGRDITEFVRERPEIEPFTVQFRGPARRTLEEDTRISTSVSELEDLARNYLELERLLEAPLHRKYPPEYDIEGLKSGIAAEMIALDERNRLGLGDGPIPILRDILEQDVGLRVFYLPMQPTTFSAIYLYTDQLGGCIAVNGRHPEERRRWSLAHDYGHFLVHRYRPTLFVDDMYQRVPESEQFADAFAAHFLMPTGGLTRRFNEIHRTRSGPTLADLCTLAHYYGVSLAALTLRLEDIRAVPTGTWDKLRASGFRVREAQQQLGLGQLPARDDTLPLRYQYLAVTALEREIITEGQFARYLGVDRLEARRIAEVLQQHSSGVTDERTVGLDLAQPLGT